MRANKPRRPEGQNAEAIFAQSVWDLLWGGGLDFNDSPTVKFSRTTKGISAKAIGGGGGGTPDRTYRVKSAVGNYLVCRTWDGTTEGTEDVKVAKPFCARQPLAETLDGVAFTYTYAVPDALNRLRTAARSGLSETQQVVPLWIVDGLIQVSAIDFSNTALAAVVGPPAVEAVPDLKLIEVSARCWARV